MVLAAMFATRRGGSTAAGRAAAAAGPRTAARMAGQQAGRTIPATATATATATPGTDAISPLPTRARHAEALPPPAW